MLPAHQGLEALDDAAARVHDRLVIEQEFTLAHRVEHGRFERDVVLRRALVAGAVDHGAALAGFLGARQGGVGQRHQAHLVLGVVRIHRHPDRGAQVDRVAAGLERRLQGGHQAPRDQLDLRLGEGPGQHRHEFVAADPGQGVAVAQRAAQAHRRHLQHGVAQRVAEAVVDLFKTVETDGGDREAVARAARVGDHHPYPVRQQHPVGQLGQGVVGRHVAQALFGRMLDRHIAADHQQRGLVAGGQARNAEFEPQVALARAEARLDQHRLVAGGGAGQRIAQRRLIDLVHQRQQRAAGFEARQALRARAGRVDRAIGRDAEHGVAGRFQQAVEQRRGQHGRDWLGRGHGGGTGVHVV